MESGSITTAWQTSWNLSMQQHTSQCFLFKADRFQKENNACNEWMEPKMSNNIFDVAIANWQGACTSDNDGDDQMFDWMANN